MNKTCSLAKGGFFHQHVFSTSPWNEIASLHGENRWLEDHLSYCILLIATLNLLFWTFAVSFMDGKHGIHSGYWHIYIYISYTLSHKMGSKGVIPSFRGMLPVAPSTIFAVKLAAQTCLPLRSMESSEASATHTICRGKGRVWGATWTIPCSKLSHHHGDRFRPQNLVLWVIFPKGRFMAHKWRWLRTTY